VTSGNIIPPKAQMVMARDFVVRRSELTVPGHSLKMMAKAAASNADQVMLDLEDACAVSQKVEARKMVVEALNTLDFNGDVISCV
jgi:citrate lyase subunit beta/citryl-CoA lyase